MIWGDGSTTIVFLVYTRSFLWLNILLEIKSIIMWPICAILITPFENNCLDASQFLHLLQSCVSFFPYFIVFLKHVLNFLFHAAIYLFLSSCNFLIYFLEPYIFFNQLSLLLPHMYYFLLDFEQQIYLLIVTTLICGLSIVVLVVLIIGKREILNCRRVIARALCCYMLLSCLWKSLGHMVSISTFWRNHKFWAEDWIRKHLSLRTREVFNSLCI